MHSLQSSKETLACQSIFFSESSVDHTLFRCHVERSKLHALSRLRFVFDRPSRRSFAIRRASRIPSHRSCRRKNHAGALGTSAIRSLRIRLNRWPALRLLNHRSGIDGKQLIVLLYSDVSLPFFFGSGSPDSANDFRYFAFMRLDVRQPQRASGDESPVDAELSNRDNNDKYGDESRHESSHSRFKAQRSQQVVTNKSKYAEEE